jgi:type I restriction enzyme, S subunit
MGQSPTADEVNESGDGAPLLNGPTEFTERHPLPIQFTEHGKKFAQKGDILFCVRGSTTGRMNYADQKYAIGRGIGAIRGKNGFPTPYVRAVIEQNLDRLLQTATGSTFPNLGRSTLNNFEVSSVSEDAAKSVNEFIVSLEDKIYLNSQINQTLEQMAQAIFNSWFVNFEPVKAKITAKKRWLAMQPDNEPSSPTCHSDELAQLPSLETYVNQAAMQAISGKDKAELTRMEAEQPEQFAEIRVTAELFPSAMQESELGKVPEGWTPARLEHHIDLVYGKALKKSSRVEGKYPVYGSGGVTGSHNEFLVRGPGVIVGRKGTVGSLYWEPNDFYPIDTTFYVTVKNGYSLSFAFYLFQTLGLANMNTDAAVPGLNRNNVYRLEVPSFPEQVIKKFTEILSSISKKISASNDENRTLSALRDSLLPKLLSGDLSTEPADDETAGAREAADV